MDAGGLRVTVAGDVCEDVLLIGSPSRLSRETPGIPVLDILDELRVDGCAAACYRQVTALGAEPFLAPTGPGPEKSRLYATQDGRSHELARWDSRWPAEDAASYGALLAQAKGDALLYCQYRPGRPSGSTLRLTRQYKRGLAVGDVRDPEPFAGTLDVIKLDAEDAWGAIAEPRPEITPDAAARVAGALANTYGYRMVVVTLGALGYAASSEGVEIMGGALPGGPYPSGAGDIFTATLAVALGVGYEVRDALNYANIAGGLSTRKEGHLATITGEEIEEWITHSTNSS